MGFWDILLFVIIFGIVFYLAYEFHKSRPKNKIIKARNTLNETLRNHNTSFSYNFNSREIGDVIATIRFCIIEMQIIAITDEMLDVFKKHLEQLSTIETSVRKEKSDREVYSDNHNQDDIYSKNINQINLNKLVSNFLADVNKYYLSYVYGIKELTADALRKKELSTRIFKWIETLSLSLLSSAIWWSIGLLIN